jgi:hypothetical protein
LGEVACSTGVESFAKVRESSDFDPGSFGKVYLFSEVLMSRMVVLEPKAKPFDRFGVVDDLISNKDGEEASR